MFRKGLRFSRLARRVLVCAVGLLAVGAAFSETLSVGSLVGGSVLAQESPYPGRRVLTEEEGRRLAEAALSFAEVRYVVRGEAYTGMPYLWGGRSSLEELQAAVADINDAVVPVSAPAPADDGARPDEQQAAPESPALPGALLPAVGVDASGVVVNALRTLYPDVRFAATAGDEPTWWADATSALLYQFNTVHLDPAELRAGDLVFFGGTVDGEVYVSGVGVVTGRSGTRVDFVVASAREGRVIHTFARTDGDYWRGNIVGAGRFLVRD